MLLVNHQVSEEPTGLIYILVNYTSHTRCTSKSSAVLVIHLTFQPGGGYSIYPWVGRCGAAPRTLTLFKTKIADFPTLFKTEFRFFNTLCKTFNPNIN